jgi:hypothetical protein
MNVYKFINIWNEFHFHRWNIVLCMTIYIAYSRNHSAALMINWYNSATVWNVTHVIEKSLWTSTCQNYVMMLGYLQYMQTDTIISVNHKSCWMVPRICINDMCNISNSRKISAMIYRCSTSFSTCFNSLSWRSCRGRDRMIVEFTTTNVISALWVRTLLSYRRGILDATLCDQVCWWLTTCQ